MKKDTKEQQRQVYLIFSGLKAADIFIWKDDSVAESNKNGGRGILIQDIQNQQGDVKVFTTSRKNIIFLPNWSFFYSLRTEDRWRIEQHNRNKNLYGQSTVRKLKGGPSNG